MCLRGQSLQGVTDNAQRFLLRFSYLGTRYAGAQRQKRREPSAIEIPTVQYALEAAINKSFLLKYPAVLSLSSRTDAGVHAVLNSAHVDLLGQSDERAFSEERLVYYVNKYMAKHNHDVVLREAIRVPYWFHARYCVQRRTYVYRIAIPKQEQPEFKRFVPLEERNYCYVMPRPVDIELMQKACKFFEGFHDFASFRKPRKLAQPSVRNISEFSLAPEHVVGRQYTEPGLADHFSWWRFTVCGTSFLYRQVRRMVGSILAVGLGEIPLEEIPAMLLAADKSGWNGRIFIIPPEGLFLKDVEYEPRSLDVDSPPVLWRVAAPFLGKEPRFPQRSGVITTKEIPKIEETPTVNESVSI